MAKNRLPKKGPNNRPLTDSEKELHFNTFCCILNGVMANPTLHGEDKDGKQRGVPLEGIAELARKAIAQGRKEGWV